MLLFPICVSAQAREHQVKAVFLFNFAQFTEWPPDSFPATNSPIVIGILGSDPFGPALEEIVHGELVRGRRIEVRHFRELDDVKSCHILYIGQSEARRLDRVIEKFKGRPVLTVSEIEGSAPRGVIIRLITERNKVRLRINTEALKDSGLIVSSKLLRFADRVQSEK